MEWPPKRWLQQEQKSAESKWPPTLDEIAGSYATAVMRLRELTGKRDETIQQLVALEKEIEKAKDVADREERLLKKIAREDHD